MMRATPANVPATATPTDPFPADTAMGGEVRVPVPADCTRPTELRRLVGLAERALTARPRRFVLDLLNLRTMNCQLLSTVIYLGRECLRNGIALVLDNVPAEFEAWVASHRLSEPIALLATRR